MLDLATRANDRLGIVNLLECSSDEFVVLDQVPTWLHWFSPEIEADRPFILSNVFLFFETYLDEVYKGLELDPDAVLNSGPWSERDAQGVERHLFACAFMVDGQLVIQIRLIEESRRYHQEVFQKAREYSIAYERLVKERERREVLMHMIVHDLAGPLTSIFGALELLRQDSSKTNLIDVALGQADVQKQMIKTILDSFSAEFTPFDASTIRHENSPRLRSILQSQVEIFRAAFSAQNVQLELVDEIPSESDLPVIAESDYLERVLSNLLENALRFSPERTTTRIRLKARDGLYAVSVCDQGEGIPDEMQEKLFEQFSGGSQFGGKQGLGLYFCRIAVERWGQSIWCESDSASEQESFLGTCMTFTLKPFTDEKG